MNIKIKRINLLLVMTLCLALSTFAQTSGGEYRGQGERNPNGNIYRGQSGGSRNRVRSRRSISFWGVLLRVLLSNSSDFNRRRGRGRY